MRFRFQFTKHRKQIALMAGILLLLLTVMALLSWKRQTQKLEQFVEMAATGVTLTGITCNAKDSTGRSYIYSGGKCVAPPPLVLPPCPKTSDGKVQVRQSGGSNCVTLESTCDSAKSSNESWFVTPPADEKLYQCIWDSCPWNMPYRHPLDGRCQSDADALAAGIMTSNVCKPANYMVPVMGIHKMSGCLDSTLNGKYFCVWPTVSVSPTLCNSQRYTIAIVSGTEENVKSVMSLRLNPRSSFPKTMADMNKTDVHTVGRNTKDVKLIMYGFATHGVTGTEKYMLCTLYRRFNEKLQQFVPVDNTSVLYYVGQCKLIVHEFRPDVPGSKPYIVYDPKALKNDYPLVGAMFEQIPY